MHKPCIKDIKKIIRESYDKHHCPYEQLAIDVEKQLISDYGISHIEARKMLQGLQVAIKNDYTMYWHN